MTNYLENVTNNWKKNSTNNLDHWITSGRSRGREGRVPTPGGSFSFRENLTKSYVGAPPESWRPHLGEIVDPPLITQAVYNLN